MNNNSDNIDPKVVQVLRWNLDAMSARPLDIRPPEDIRDLIRHTDELPALPETARRLLYLLDDPDADAGDLAKIVELDPLLAAQMVRWANSAYYAPPRPIDSIKEAIARVLGFEQAASLALGLIALSPLETPRKGIVGRDAVIRHGIQSSRLMLTLARSLPEPIRPAAGLVQLTGLIQNIGYLLLGHLLPAAFAALNNILIHNPTVELPVAERFVLGVEHGQLGFWLLEAWGMPLPLQTLVRHHHNPNYCGPQQPLTLLAGLADHLLGSTPAGLGPAPAEATTLALMRRLELEPDACREAFGKIVASGALKT